MKFLFNLNEDEKKSLAKRVPSQIQHILSNSLHYSSFSLDFFDFFFQFEMQ